MIAPLVAGLLGALLAAAGIVVLWLWQEHRRGLPPGPLARRLGPFLDLLDARYAPLVFVATPQAFTVYAWLLTDGAPPWVAVMGGIGFEFVYVGAIAWAERGAGWEAARVPAVTALLFSVAVAVAHYGTTRGTLAVLHIGFPVVGYAYTRMMHAPTGTRAADVSHERDSLRAERDALAHERDTAAREAGRAWDAARAAETERDDARVEAGHWQAMASRAVPPPALTGDSEMVEIGTRRVTLRGLSRELEIDKNKLSRAVARAGQGDG
jgi:hypothetical protein